MDNLLYSLICICVSTYVLIDITIRNLKDGVYIYTKNQLRVLSVIAVTVVSIPLVQLVVYLADKTNVLLTTAAVVFSVALFLGCLVFAKVLVCHAHYLNWFAATEDILVTVCNLYTKMQYTSINKENIATFNASIKSINEAMEVVNKHYRVPRNVMTPNIARLIKIEYWVKKVNAITDAQ